MSISNCSGISNRGMSISNCWVGNWGIAEVVSSVCRGSNSSGISNRGMSISNWGGSISHWGMSISNWCRGNSDWLNVDIRLSWDLDINVRLSSDFLMDIRLSSNLGINVRLSSNLLMHIRLSSNLDINVRLSSNFLMHIFFSGDLDINVWLSKGVQVSVCYGRIISSSINSSNWGMSISNRLSSITVCIWTSSIGSGSYGGSSSVSIGSRVSISSCWDDSSASGGHTGKDCNKGSHI